MAKNCRFCNLKEKGRVIKNYKYWTLILSESQFILGWSHAILRRHIEHFEELTDKELSELKQVIKELKSALNKTFKPDWFNIMQLGNMTKHLHFHIFPRYIKPRKFDKKVFVDKDYGDMVVNRWKKEDKKFLTRLTNHIKDSI